mgnify:FL=1
MNLHILIVYIFNVGHIVGGKEEKKEVKEEFRLYHNNEVRRSK